MATERELHLFFEDGESPQLVRSLFYPAGDNPPIIGMRSSYSRSSFLPFRWNTTNHAVCVFLVNARLKAHSSTLHEPILVGERNTMAASLGRVFRKQKLSSIFEIFGSDISGRPNLNRMILCYNYNRRVPGPIRVYFRSTFVRPEQIRIFTDEKEISSCENVLAEFAKRLEASWLPYGTKKRRGAANSKAPSSIKPKNHDQPNLT